MKASINNVNRRVLFFGWSVPNNSILVLILLSIIFIQAPEVIQQKEPDCYSPESDIYAYGCVLFEMFSGKLPHAPISNKEQVI